MTWTAMSHHQHEKKGFPKKELISIFTKICPLNAMSNFFIIQYRNFRHGQKEFCNDSFTWGLKTWSHLQGLWEASNSFLHDFFSGEDVKKLMSNIKLNSVLFWTNYIANKQIMETLIPKFSHKSATISYLRTLEISFSGLTKEPMVVWHQPNKPPRSQKPLQTCS